MTYPSQRQVRYTDDAADRLSTVTRGAVSVSIPKYLATGVPEEMVYGNGVKETWALTKRLQVDSIAVTRGVSSLLTLNYGYGTGIENNGNVRTQTIRAGGHTFVQSYGYDPVNRLSQASETTTVAGATGWSIGFEYDRYGNMAAKDWTLVVPTAMATSLAQYNGPLNRRDRTVSGVAMSPNPYDKAGNLISDAALGTMQYDQAGRLRRTQVLGKTVNYDYDAEGRRVRRDLPGLGTTYYVYDGSGQLAAEYGASEPSGCSLCYLTADMLGSTRLVTDGAGGVNQRMDYLPFGDIVTASLTQGGGRNVITDGTAQTTYALASAPTQRFTGKERDGETGLDYFGARYMASAWGRFTSPDAPMTEQDVHYPQSWNLYSYVRNSPLTRIDPTGRCSKKNGSDQATDDPDEPCVAAGDTTVTVNEKSDEVPLVPIPVGGSEGVTATKDSSGTTSNDSQLNSAQCRAIRIVLAREAQYGTPRAARMSGNTKGDGTLEPFNSTFAPNLQSPIGEIDLDWYTDLVGYSAGFAPVVYPIAKTAWTILRLAVGVPIGNPGPFQDPGETQALFSVVSGQRYRDIFPVEFMTQACRGR